MAEKTTSKEQPDQWAQEAVPALQQPEVTDWAAETMNVPPAIGGQFSMTTTATTDDWSAQTEDWSTQVSTTTGASTAAPPTAQWGGDTVESWN